MLLGVAVGQLTGSLSSIALPALMGLQIKPIAITSTDPDADGALSFLSIFANVSTATGPARRSVDTPRLARGHAAAADAASSRSARAAPTCRRRCWRSTAPAPIASSTPGPSTAGRGRRSPRPTRAVVTDPLLWMQGRHTIDVRARAVGQPGTTDADAGARRRPRRHRGADRRLRRRRQRARASTPATPVSPPEALQFRFKVDGGAFGAWMNGDHAFMPVALDAAHVTVEVTRRGRQHRHARLPRPLDRAVDRAAARATSPAAAARGQQTGGALLLVAIAGVARRARAAPSYLWLRRIAIAAGAACLAAVGARPPAAARTASARATTPTPTTRLAATTTSPSPTARSTSAPTTTPWATSSTPRSRIRRSIPGWQVVDGVDTHRVARHARAAIAPASAIPAPTSACTPRSRCLRARR